MGTEFPPMEDEYSLEAGGSLLQPPDPTTLACLFFSYGQRHQPKGLQHPDKWLSCLYLIGLLSLVKKSNQCLMGVSENGQRRQERGQLRDMLQFSENV